MVDQYDRCAVCNGSGYAEHTAETVKQRNRNAQTVIVCKLHTVADGLAVVDDIVMCEHHAFRKSCRTRGILHIHNIVQRGTLFGELQFEITDVICKFVKLREVEHAVHFFVLEIDDVFQEGKVFALQFARCGKFQRRAEFVDHFDIIDFLRALGHNQCHRVGLLKQIIQFEIAVIGIDRDHDGADACGGKHCKYPFGIVGRPNCHMISFSDTDCVQAFGDFIDSVPKFAIVPADVFFGADDCFVFRI